MARKTTISMKKAIIRHNSAMEHFTSVIAAKHRGDESEFFKKHSIDYYIGMAYGHSMMLENTLMENNTYHGFQYIDSLGRPITPEHDDYQEWRVRYIIKE